MSELHLPNPDQLTRQPRSPSQGGAETEQVSAEEALEEMKGRLASETARAAAAERAAADSDARRAAAEGRATEATGTAMSAHERSIVSGIETQMSIVDQAEAAIATAYGAGDAIALAKAQRQMGEATARLTSLEQQKEWFASEKARQEAEAKRAPPQQQAPTGSVRVVTPGGEHTVSGADKDWMDKHPRFFNDPDYYNQAIAAHTTLVAQGAQPGSAIYYQGLTDKMSRYEAFEAHERGEAPVNDGLSQRQQARRGTPSSSVAAPVSRGTPRPQSSGGVMSEQQIAQHIGAGVTTSDLREYARINGYKGEEGYQRYLAAQTEVIQLERSGQDTGLRSDALYR